jgi:hypothetical protein
MADLKAAADVALALARDRRNRRGEGMKTELER